MRNVCTAHMKLLSVKERAHTHIPKGIVSWWIGWSSVHIAHRLTFEWNCANGHMVFQVIEWMFIRLMFPAICRMRTTHKHTHTQRKRIWDSFGCKNVKWLRLELHPTNRNHFKLISGCVLFNLYVLRPFSDVFHFSILLFKFELKFALCKHHLGRIHTGDDYCHHYIINSGSTKFSPFKPNARFCICMCAVLYRETIHMQNFN